MKQHGSTKQISQHALAFLAAGLFYLAGFIFMVTALRSRGSISTGVMFVCVGSLWVVIAAKYKKKAQ